MGDVRPAPARSRVSESEDGRVVVGLVKYQASRILVFSLRPSENRLVVDYFIRYKFYGGFCENER